LNGVPEAENFDHINMVSVQKFLKRYNKARNTNVEDEKLAKEKQLVEKNCRVEIYQAMSKSKYLGVTIPKPFNLERGKSAERASRRNICNTMLGSQDFSQCSPLNSGMYTSTTQFGLTGRSLNMANSALLSSAQQEEAARVLSIRPVEHNLKVGQ